MDKGLKNGDMIGIEHPAYNELVGYRIPSTELHSAVPLKVIGYYPSAENDNIIIVPKEIVLLHGSDFDIDTLYTLNAALAVKTIPGLSVVGVPIGKTSEYTIVDNQVVLTKDSNDNYVITDIPYFLDTVQAEIEDLQKNGIESLSKENKQRLKDLTELYNKGISNDILYTYINMISGEKNIEFMMKPITQLPFEDKDKSSPESTLAYVKAKQTGNQEYIDQYEKNEIDVKLRDKILKGNVFLSNFLHQVKIHGDNFLAKDLTGISANFMKGIRYLFIGALEQDPTIHEDFNFVFNNKSYNSLTRLQRDQAGNILENEFNTDIIDTIINNQARIIINAQKLGS